jgi:hypothetical protein
MAANWNRFNENIYIPRALLSAADSSFEQFPDTTISVNASGKRVLWYNLHDPRFVEQSDRFNYDAFRVAELNASYRAVDGPMPIYGCIIITALGDSVVFWNALTSTRWSVVIKAANNACGNNTFNDLDFDDGKVNVATSGGKCEIDLLADQILFFTTSGISKYSGTFSQRNSALGSLVVNASPAIVNNTVNSVSAIRDPGGKRDPATGRLAQWWMVGTAAGESVFNPYANAIYDNTTRAANTMYSTFSPFGYYAGVRNAGWLVDYRLSTMAFLADGALNIGGWNSSGTGSEKTAWATGAATQRKPAIVERASIAGTAAPQILVAADSGLVILHAKANDNTNGGQQLIESGFNSGYMKGTVGAAYPLESDGTDISPNAYNLTSIGGTHTYVNGVIGKADSITGATAGWLVADKANLRVATGDWSWSCWFKSINASNPGATQVLLSSFPGGAGPYMTLTINTSGYLVGTASSTASNAVTGGADLYDGNWHFVGYTRSGSTEYLYADGELHTSVAVTHGTVNNDSLSIGAYNDGSSPFTGVIDNPIVTVGSALTPTEIRYMYQQGLAAIASTVSPCDCLPGHIGGTTDSTGYVKAHPSGERLLGNQDTLMVLDKYGIPTWKMGSPGGLIQDADFADVGGGDSLGVVVVSKAKVGSAAVVYQRIPDVRIADLAGYQWPFKQPMIGKEVVVDSSGTNGLFWTLNDAAAATVNMRQQTGRNEIYVERGTYPASQVVSQDSLKITGTGNYQTVFNGGVTSVGLSVTGKGNTFIDIGAQTTATGGGTACSSGPCDAWSVTGIENTFIRPRALQSDDDAFSFSSAAKKNILDHPTATSIDGMGVNSSAIRLGVLYPTFSTAGSSITADATSDSLNVIGGQLIGAKGAVTLKVGADLSVVNGTVNDVAHSNSSASSILIGNLK